MNGFFVIILIMIMFTMEGGGRSEHTKDQVTSDVEKNPQTLKFNGMKMCEF